MTQPQLKTDIEARVKDTGDTMTGNLIISGTTYPRTGYLSTEGTYSWIEGNGRGTSILAQLAYGDIGYRALRLSNTNYNTSNCLQIVEKTEDAIFTTYDILHSGNCENYASASATLLKPTENISTLTYGKGGWGANVEANEGKIIWRERFVDTALTTDSGDIVFWLKKSSDTASILNITIDGYFYQNHSHLLLDDSNYKNYALPLTGGTLTGKLILKGTNDSAATTANSGLLLIGDPNSLHLSIDANEIMCKNSATTAGDLYLNNDGGQIITGSGNMIINGSLTLKKASYAESSFCLKRANVTKGTLPSATVYWTFNNCDVNGDAYKNALGQFETSLSTAGLTKTYIRARQFVVNTASTIITPTLYVQVDINGNTKAGIDGASFYGAVWNDYAEYREYHDSDEIPYGRVVIENGDDSLSISTERLQAGGNICSDTFGFAIGETDDCKLPIAVSGRVLAYPLEGREAFAANIGRPVCSGPNGTVSIMTDEEYQKYGYCAIGTISAIPKYEVWGTGNVKVDGRVWIQIK